MQDFTYYDYTIRSEKELLDMIRSSIEGGLTPLVMINGEYYSFDLTYLMTDGEKCRWCNNRICGLVNITGTEDPTCDGSVESINKCRRIKQW